jgi:ubiquinone/menaquinone biosynthesis C-methylase UbiE
MTGSLRALSRGRWTGRLAEVLIDFAELPGDGPVLDVGCGTGSGALELRRRLPDRSVVAVDVSAAYLAFAQGRDGGRDIRFELADGARLPFETGAFAGAIAQLALNFMPDPRAGGPGYAPRHALWWGARCRGLGFLR